MIFIKRTQEFFSSQVVDIAKAIQMAELLED